LSTFGIQNPADSELLQLYKDKGKVVTVLNKAPCHEDILG